MSRYVQFGEGNNLTNMSSSQVPASLHEKFTLLRYFAQYMDENLTEGGDSQPLPTYRRSSFVHMKRWVRTPKAIIMQLDNNTLQVLNALSLHPYSPLFHPSFHPFSSIHLLQLLQLLPPPTTTDHRFILPSSPSPFPYF